MPTDLTDSDKEGIIADSKVKLAQAKAVRTQWEAWCATVENFFNGKHTEWWDEDGNIRKKTLSPHEVWRQINLMPGAEDIRQNRLTKNPPRWHVKQSHGMVASSEDIDAANAYLQSIYITENWRDKVKKVIGYGDKRGVTPTVISWDKKRSKPELNIYDAWDFYPDPTANHPKSWMTLNISTPISLEAIKQMPDIGKEQADQLVSAGRYAQSKLKDDIIRNQHGGSAPKGMYMRNQYFVIKETPQGKGIYEYNIIGDELIGKGKFHQYDSFDDFIDLYKPRDTDKFYERPPCSDWVPLQKSINKIFSSIEGYIDTSLQGRWRRSDKSVAVPLAGEHGQIFDAVIGDIEQFNMQALPQTHFQHFDNAVQQFETVAGVHGESYGRSSGGEISGVALAQLQANDEQNSATAGDNLKTYLQRVATKTLSVASKNLNIRQPVFIETEPGESTRIDVIGEEAKTLRDLKDVAGLQAFTDIEVEIVVGSAYSDFQQQEAVKELIGVGYVPGENPIMDRLVGRSWTVGSQRELTKMMEDLNSPARMMAQAENQMMRGGAFLEVRASDEHGVHMEIHNTEQKKLQALGDVEGMENVAKHIEEHKLVMKEVRNGARSQEEENTV
jgi:hypothetical protein